MQRRRALAAVGATASAVLAGCVGSFPTSDETATRPRDAPDDVESDGVAYTYGRPTGNRVAPGVATLDDSAHLTVELSGTPAWLVGAAAPDGDGTLWAVASEAGDLDAVRVPGDDAATAEASVSPDALPAGTPPAFEPAAGRVLEPPAWASTLAHPTPTPAGVVVVESDGGLRVGDATHDVEALPDARLAVGADRAVLLAGATRQYDHGALGDGVEAGAIATISLSDGAVSTVPVARGVVEGTQPILADVTGDGARDVVVTEADADVGARIVAYDHAGSVVARGPAVGAGYRWRHQLAVAPFAPDGVPEVAVVRTPHVGGTVEFYRRDGDALRIAATAGGYSSHALGSRNLDGARAVDADGDGRPELVVPTDDREHLAVLARTRDGAREVERAALDAPVSGNLATATVDGATSVAVATADGRLHVWRPRNRPHWEAP